jgi:hypothetical protein
MIGLIGTTVMIKVDGFSVPMTINDAKTAYGNRRFLVSPVGGSGESWVDASRVDSGVAKPSAPAAKPAALSSVEIDSETGRIRAWARDRGIHVNERGRIPTQVMNQFLMETESSQTIVDEAIAS